MTKQNGPANLTAPGPLRLLFGGQDRSHERTNLFFVLKFRFFVELGSSAAHRRFGALASFTGLAAGTSSFGLDRIQAS